MNKNKTRCIVETQLQIMQSSVDMTKSPDSLGPHGIVHAFHHVTIMKNYALTVKEDPLRVRHIQWK